MLHAPVNETNAENGQTRRSLTPLPERERYPLSVEAPERPSLTGSASRSTQRPAVARSRSAVGSLQRLYGNQAVLQMRYGSGGLPAPSVPLRPSQSGIFQRKCACGGAAGMSGKCEECSEKMGFGLQTKLTIGEPGDAYEQEADRIADQVMSTSAHPAASSAPPRIQRLAGQPTAQVDAAPGSVDQTLASTGKPLEPALREDMEQRFGYDFSRVRVHSGAAAEQSAQEVNANAYTMGHDLVFGVGQFAPGTHQGRRLVAHELTHVVQQSGEMPRPRPTLQRQPKETKEKTKPSAKFIGCEKRQAEIDDSMKQAKSLASQATAAFEREYPLTYQATAMDAHFGRNLKGDQKRTIIRRYKDIRDNLETKTYTCSEANNQNQKKRCAEGTCPGSEITVFPSYGTKVCPDRGAILLHEAAHNAGACGDIDRGEQYPPEQAEDNAYSYEHFASAVAKGENEGPTLRKRDPKKP